LRARLRMSTLYSVATNYEYLVVGTENLAEWYTGYFTMYGDGGVDIKPLMDLTKVEVKDLGKHLGTTKDILDKVARADLGEGKTKKDNKLKENMNEKTNHKRHIAKQYRFKK